MSNRTIIDAMLADIAFTGPVEVEDCKAVYTALKEALPDTLVEVYFHTGAVGDDVVIRVDNLVRKVAIS